MNASFDQLIAEGSSVPTAGWDFGWFEGRASEERPQWGYAKAARERGARARAVLDVQTGDGTIPAGIDPRPPVVMATESWEPNLDLARGLLGDANVAQVADDADLPFGDGSFDLVLSRHPTVVLWEEIARVLQPGGRYFAQHVGPGTVHELSVAMLGDFEPSSARDADRGVAQAQAAGLRVRDLRKARLRMEFWDVAAVVHFLRKVIWIVPGFTAEQYLPQLRDVHTQILATGSFVAHSTRYLIEAEAGE